MTSANPSSTFAPLRMRAFIPSLVVALAVGVSASVASAQTANPDSGARVRVRLHSDRDYIYEGTLLAPVGDSLIARVPGEPTLRVPRSDLHRLQVATRGGRAPGTFAGIGIGLFTGAAIGAVIGYATSNPDDFFGPEFGAAVGATLLGVAGGVTGGIVGYNRRGTAWRDVPLTASVGLRGARVSIAF